MQVSVSLLSYLLHATKAMTQTATMTMAAAAAAREDTALRGERRETPSLSSSSLEEADEEETEEKGKPRVV